jgi:hypothetical protein
MTIPAAPRRSTDAINAAAVLLLGALLYAAGSGIMEQWQQSSARQQGLHPEHVLGAAAAAGGAALVSWWCLAFVFAGAAAILERTGRTRAAAVTRKLSPALMQRLVLAGLSLQLLSGPAAHAAVTVPGPEWTPTQDRVASAPLDAGGEAQETMGQAPAVEGATATAPAGSVQQAAAPAQAIPGEQDNPSPYVEEPSSTASLSVQQPLSVEERRENPATPPSDLAPGWQPAAPVASPGLLAPPASRAADDAGSEASAVTVLAGDTLWDIAAHAMGPGASDVEIAMHWPRWYEANRAIIGQNPDVLLPGQILQPPFGAH